MESATGRGRGGGGRGLQLTILLLLLWTSRQEHVLGCSPAQCGAMLTEVQGVFSSPCYPQKYPNSQVCRWTLQAPAGFIVQISFLDFDLEEAPGCIYDRVLVKTGGADVKFCGPTASGLSLNSTGNLMELSFTSDFSVQKRGFSVSYRHVAVALRNQKVAISGGSDGHVTQVSEAVEFPELSELTLCFEVERISQKQEEWFFSYSHSSSHVALGLVSEAGALQLIVAGASCPLNQSRLSSSSFTSSMTPLCLQWSSADGLLGVLLRGHYWTQTCSASSGRLLPPGGRFRLGGPHSLDGYMYNLRLWAELVPLQDLQQLQLQGCDAAGSLLDWDKQHWDIPASLAQTDPSLSCSVSPPSSTGNSSSCDSTGLGCPAASPSDATNTTHTTNVSAHALPTAPPSSDITASMQPLTSSAGATSAVLSSVLPAASATSTASAAAAKPALASSSSTTYAPQPTSSWSSAGNPLPMPAAREGFFYRLSLEVVAVDDTLTAPPVDVERTVGLWLNETFHNWSRSVQVEQLSVQPNLQQPNSYSLQALLVYFYASNQSLSESAVSARLSSREALLGRGLQLTHVHVRLIENCPEEKQLHYRWPESRASVTQRLPCFPNKEQSASRTCLINPQNLSSYWSAADATNCTDIDTIEVSAENAAEVAVQLAVITNNQLSNEEVSKVVSKVKQLVDVAKVNSSLASTVVTIISNVMSSSHTQLESNTSGTALRTVDQLVHKLEFEGPSISFSSRHLAVGVASLDTDVAFNGTTFSAIMAPNASEPQVQFQLEQADVLGQVTLPASLLAAAEGFSPPPSRINFMFFSSTNLFQKEQRGHALNSYVVASSVGNLTVRDLEEPVQIHIAHLDQQRSVNPVCVFWDFNLNGGSGGWNEAGCRVSAESSANRTICLCDHLTHFGVLMDISGASSHLDSRTNQVLTFITYVGCGVSAVFSAATLLTYIAFEKLRRDYPSKILMNLSSSLLLLNLVFLLDGWLASLGGGLLCRGVAALLHYFLLTSFTWMGLESVHMYIALVKVFNTYIRRYILKFCLVGWGLPAVLVVTVVAADRNSYGLQEYGTGGDGGRGSEFCWLLSPLLFYSTCVGFFCLVFLLNMAMFVVVMMQICGRNGKRSNRTLREEVLRNLRSVVSLTFLLGMTWGFALFAWGPVTVAFIYLFCIFNSLQGLFIFIFHCALKENVQKQWRRYLCCGRFRLSDHSDWSKTATNTKKVSSDKSLSSSSLGSSATHWTSKAKATLNPFSKRNSGSGEDKCQAKIGVSSSSSSCSSSSPPTTELQPGSAASSSPSPSILPVSQMIDKVRGYCSSRTDNFYKNILMSDSLAHSTKF